MARAEHRRARTALAGRRRRADLRDADAERVHALLDDAYAGWDPDYVARSHAGWLTFMTEHDEFDPALWFLVERDGELVGCALHWREHQGRGWVKDIVVARASAATVSARRSCSTASARTRERGVERVGLKVDSTNPTGAPALYERLGFVTDQRYGIWAEAPVTTADDRVAPALAAPAAARAQRRSANGSRRRSPTTTRPKHAGSSQRMPFNDAQRHHVERCSTSGSARYETDSTDDACSRRR